MGEASRVRRVKDWGKSQIRTVFETGQRFGVDVLPRHFYSQIPNIRAMKADRSWQRPYSLVGVGGRDVEQQLNWLRKVCPPDVAATLPSLALQQEAGKANGALGYGPIESDLLYCVVRTLTPKRMIQVGAGASTWVALKAAEDAGTTIDITCVDPFPTEFLTQLSTAGKITLRHEPVQAVDPAELARLEPGDVLFVDSTHTVSPGSDVNHMILEVLPRLPKGVIVHFHDITIPYGYSAHVLSDDLFFWNETVLLHAYLADNPRFEIRAAMALLHDAALPRVQEIIPTYRDPMRTERGVRVGEREGQFPTAMWLEVVA
ncbi:class I SAM-dependent methyltransferase [Mycolicibacterium sp. XJ1819]